MALVGKNSEKNNQNLMQLIRRAHGLVENPDLEKHRQSQDHMASCSATVKRSSTVPWTSMAWMRSGSAGTGLI